MSSFRDEGRHDFRPRSYIDSCIHIRSRSVATGLAHKLSLALAVGSLAMPALGTCLGRIARVNQIDQHSGKKGLVFDKRAELVVRPVTMPRTLRPSNRGSLTQVSKVFE